MRVLAPLCLALLALPAIAAEGVSPTVLSDSQVHAVLDWSAAQYDGACPCPYTVKPNGRQCRGASAWSRPGGDPVLCFPEDVTNESAGALFRSFLRR